MRNRTTVRNLLFAALLVASNVVFASHTVTHINSQAGNCELCVCQGQTPAAPLPDAVQVCVRPQAMLLPVTLDITLLPEPDSRRYQPRAPPPVI